MTNWKLLLKVSIIKLCQFANLINISLRQGNTEITNRTSDNGISIRHFIETASLAGMFLGLSVVLTSVLNTTDITSLDGIVLFVLIVISLFMFLVFSIGLLWNRIGNEYSKLFDAPQTSRMKQWCLPIIVTVMWLAISIGFLVDALQYPLQLAEPYRSVAIWLGIIWPIYVVIALIILRLKTDWDKIRQLILRMLGRKFFNGKGENEATQTITENDTIYLADTPILSINDDRLGRAKFAQYLGDAILAWKRTDSIVIGLYGHWGLGKTSILYMMIEYIEEKTKDIPPDMKPLILRFNPWNFSEQNQLISMFFHELSILLGRKDRSKTAKILGRKLETYSKFFEPLAIIPSFGFWATIIAKLLKALGRSSSQWGQIKEIDLVGIREEINRYLKERKSRIIVFIDDIDRLSPIEIKQTFQLLKLNADFPNTIYVTAFDPEIVAKALEVSHKIPGKEYLEKIVQINFDVPPIEPSRLANLLFEELNKILAYIPKENWDERRWGNLYHSGFKKLFNTVRDVKRFINGLLFDFSLVLEEVNPIDLIGIEGIRIFAPEMYQLIVQNKDLFTGTEHIENKEILKQRYEKIFSVAPERIREPIRQICRQLFPQLEYVYQNLSYRDGWQKQWRRELRICAIEVFDKYFLLEVPEGEISEVRIRKILSLTSYENKFTNALKELNKSGEIVRFLERLEDYTSIVPLGHIGSICKALLDIGDDLPLDRHGSAKINVEMKAFIVIHQLLNRIENEQSRIKALKDAVSTTRSIYFPVYVVSLEEPDESENTKPLASEDSFQTLKGSCIEKIREASKSNRLQKIPKLDYVLFRWKEWGDPIDAKQYVNKLLETTEGLADFLVGCMSRRTSQYLGDYVATSDWIIPINNIQEFTTLDFVIEKVNKITTKQQGALSTKQLQAIETFRMGINEKKRGNQSNQVD